MDSTFVIILLIGVAVVGIVASLGIFLAKTPGELAERRLAGLHAAARGPGQAGAVGAGALLRPTAINLESAKRWHEFLPNLEGLNRLYEQADVKLPFKQFLSISAVLAALGWVVGFVLGAPLLLLPVAGLLLGSMPWLWLVLRKRKRIKKFTSQMPDALELTARALRAGHGLAAGLNVVADEMPPPISQEFGRIYEEQNLGIPLEEALRGLTDRVPTMDIRFFVTAVVIQRATGGDLAEVLDKIGRIIRERFQIQGQVQALTAEGRLSGVVLLAMPPSLLAFVYWTNPDYAGLLFSTDLGLKMLAVAGVLQVLGAIAIKKIITIKI